jgi:hypothetical protein
MSRYYNKAITRDIFSKTYNKSAFKFINYTGGNTLQQNINESNKVQNDLNVCNQSKFHNDVEIQNDLIVCGQSKFHNDVEIYNNLNVCGVINQNGFPLIPSNAYIIGQGDPIAGYTVFGDSFTINGTILYLYQINST